MPFLLQYLFKLSLTLAVLYLFYYVLLRKLTFYTWNRFYLLCYSLLSFIIPFVNITPWIQDKPIAGSSLINSVSFIARLNGISAVPAAQEAMYFSPYNVVLFLFAGGAAVMLIRLLLQVVSIQAIKRRATLIHANNVRLYDVDSPISPFSFARSIFINTRQYSEEDLQKIIQHEFVHVKQQHTVDLLAGELLCIVNWYNPFAWLIRKAIRQNLEFIADHSVLQTGLDAQQYQYLLLQVTGLPRYSVSNNFNISSLKQRIFMMNKLKSAQAHLLKFLFVLPLLAVTLLAFRGQQQLHEQQNHLLHNKDLARDTVPPKPPLPPTINTEPDQVRPMAPPPPPVPRAVKSISIEASNNKATVVLKNGRKEVYDLTNPSERAAYEKKYSLLPPPPPPPPPPLVMSPADVYFIDSAGKKQKMKMYRNKNNFYNIQEGLYKSKEDEYRKKEAEYNKKEDEYRKKEDEYKSKEKTYNDNEAVYITADSVTLPAGTYSLKGTLGISPKTAFIDPLPPVYVIDGVVSSTADFSNTNPQQIKSITLLKGEDASRLYGNKAANGVMIINTKRGSAAAFSGKTSFPILGDINSLNNYSGLTIINGKEASKADVEGMLTSLHKDPFTFTLNMTVLKKEEAVQKYGNNGKDGVTIVTYQLKEP